MTRYLRLQNDFLQTVMEESAMMKKKIAELEVRVTGCTEGYVCQQQKNIYTSQIGEL